MAFKVKLVNQNHAAKRSQMTNFLMKGLWTDATIFVKNEGIKVHRIVLAGSSSFFMRLFSEDGGNGDKYEIKEFSFKELRSLVWFLYTERVDVKVDEYQRFLQICDIVGIKVKAEEPAPEGKPEDIKTIQVAAIKKTVDTLDETLSWDSDPCTPPSFRVEELITEPASYLVMTDEQEIGTIAAESIAACFEPRREPGEAEEIKQEAVHPRVRRALFPVPKKSISPPKPVKKKRNRPI